MVQIIARTKKLSETKRAQINQAAGSARDMANRLWSHWEVIYEQSGNKRKKRRLRTAAWKSSPPFSEWFGRRVLTNPQFNRVNRRLRKVRGTLNQPEKIKIVYKPDGFCCNNKKRKAWNGGFKRRRIHICDGFFELSSSGRATALIHEMVHATGIGQWGHPGGASYSATKSRQRAIDHPRKARRNPYNFEHLFNSFRNP